MRRMASIRILAIRMSPAVIAELKKQGFKGAITIECELNGTRHDYVIQTRKYLQELLER